MWKQCENNERGATQPNNGRMKEREKEREKRMKEMLVRFANFDLMHEN